VIEDSFVCGRPAWEKRGALFTSQIEPYMDMKLRLLNAGHSAMCYGAYLLGHRFIDCAMLDGAVRGFLVAFMQEQAATLPLIPGELATRDVDNYMNQIVERFTNPYIKDAIWRVAQDGSLKFAATMRAPALCNAEAGRSVACFACAVACWARFLVGVDEAGDSIDCVLDPRAAELTALSRAVFQCSACGAVGAPCTAVLPPSGTTDVTAFLASIFGEEFAENGSIVEEVIDALTTLANSSTRHLMTHRVKHYGL